MWLDKAAKPFSHSTPRESSGGVVGLLDRLFGGRSRDTACRLLGGKLQVTEIPSQEMYGGGAGDVWEQLRALYGMEEEPGSLVSPGHQEDKGGV